jgi:hypothetical protein
MDKLKTVWNEHFKSFFLLLFSILCLWSISLSINIEFFFEIFIFWKCLSIATDSPYKYSEADTKGMLGFLLDNINEVFGDQVFEQSVNIPMGTNCAPLLADLVLY